MTKFKRIIPFLILLFVIGCATNKNSNSVNKKATTWEKDNLKGKVKTFYEISYERDTSENMVKEDLKSDSIYWKFIAKTASEYDKNGNIIARRWYDEYDYLTGGDTYKYNKKQSKIEWERYNVFNDTENFIVYYIYDNKGNQIKKNIYEKEELVERHTYKYDKKNNLIEYKWFNRDGSLRFLRTYKYDSNGNQIELNWHEIGSPSHNRYTSKYNKKGQKIKEDLDVYSKNTFVSHDTKWIYKYNSKGNLIKVYKYWFNKKYKENDYLYETFLYKYDTNNNEIERTIYDTNGNLERKYTCKYQYDKKGNWTKQTHYVDGVVVEKYERVYEYYK